MDLIQLNDGLWWPASDRECHDKVARSLEDIPAILSHVHPRRVCVQAGGNAGLWPRELAEWFRQVVTFEPEPVNFSALARNVTAANVVKIQAALGDHAGPVEMTIEPENTGHHHIGAGQPALMLRLDDLALVDIDYLQLDVEGYEWFAIDGAWRTIERWLPLIQLEDKGFGKAYGHTEAETVQRLVDVGYRPVMRVKRDVVLRHDRGAFGKTLPRPGDVRGILSPEALEEEAGKPHGLRPYRDKSS